MNGFVTRTFTLGGERNDVPARAGIRKCVCTLDTGQRDEELAALPIGSPYVDTGLTLWRSSVVCEHEMFPFEVLVRAHHDYIVGDRVVIVRDVDNMYGNSDCDDLARQMLQVAVQRSACDAEALQSMCNVEGWTMEWLRRMAMVVCMCPRYWALYTKETVDFLASVSMSALDTPARNVTSVWHHIRYEYSTKFEELVLFTQDPLALHVHVEAGLKHVGTPFGPWNEFGKVINTCTSLPRWSVELGVWCGSGWKGGGSRVRRRNFLEPSIRIRIQRR